LLFLYISFVQAKLDNHVCPVETNLKGLHAVSARDAEVSAVKNSELSITLKLPVATTTFATV
jgi:hypothetical protein